jgi:6-phosphogluconolactonase
MTASKWIAVVVAGIVTICLCASLASFAETQRSNSRVYLMTNDETANAIIVFDRAADGTLTHLQDTSTGGRGAGFGTLPAFLPPAPGPNPLQSQDGVVLTADGRFLLAVNAGSNELSVFAVTRDGLQLVSKAPTRGVFPVSIAVHKELVYILNEGDNAAETLGGIPNIVGFRVDKHGSLQEIPNSQRTAGSNPSHPADIIFNAEGTLLILTEKFTDVIDIFHINNEGIAAGKVSIPPNNLTPFGIAMGLHNIVAITETNSFLDNGRRNAVPDGSSTSTYRITKDGTLEPVSRAIPNGQTASCWIRFTPNGRFAYTTNKGSGSISLYGVSPAGELTLLKKVVADTGGALSGPIDLAITHDGKFLYVIASFIQTLQSYRIEPDGSLLAVQSISNLPLTAQGIAAR